MAKKIAKKKVAKKVTKKAAKKTVKKTAKKVVAKKATKKVAKKVAVKAPTKKKILKTDRIAESSIGETFEGISSPAVMAPITIPEDLSSLDESAL